MSLVLMNSLWSILEEEWSRAQSVSDKAIVASLGAFALIASCGSFRGPVLFAVDLHGLRKYLLEDLRSNGREYVNVPLLCRFKNELGDQYHLTPLVAETRSGLKVKLLIQHNSCTYVSQTRLKFRYNQ